MDFIIEPKCQICWNKPAVRTMKLVDEVDKQIKDFKVCEECGRSL